MKHITSQILVANEQNVAATKTWDFDVPLEAAGVIAEVQTSDPQTTPSFTFSLGDVWDNGSLTNLITTAAVTTATVTRLGAVPGVVAVTNVFANEPVCGKMRFTATRSAGTMDLRVILHFFG